MGPDEARNGPTVAGPTGFVTLCSRCGSPSEPGRPRCAPCAEAVGPAVNRKLTATPGVVRLPSDKLELFVMRDFLDAANCEKLIDLIDADRVPSAILATNPDPTFRTSESCNMDRRNPFVLEMEDKIRAVLGIERAYGERIQGQRYDLTQRFKAHHDFFYVDQPYWPQEDRNGGQRTWTAMVFLNEPEEGGQTLFPKIGARITPRRGNLLVWNNLDAAGMPNLYSMHEALPVAAGLKYVVTKWFRERPWAVPTAPAPAPPPRIQVKLGERTTRRAGSTGGPERGR